MDGHNYEKEKQFKSMLINALEDVVVANKIRSVVESVNELDVPSKYVFNAHDNLNKIDTDDLLVEKLKDLENQNRELLADKEQMVECISIKDHKINELLEKNKQQEERIIVLEDTCKKWWQYSENFKKEIVSREGELHRLKNIAGQFEYVLNNFELYSRLSEKLKSVASNIIDASSPMVFLLTASDKGNVLAFWDTVKYLVDETSDDELDVIIEILRFFVGLLNERERGEIYLLMDGEMGKMFDNERHIRGTNCSRYSGEIKKIVVPGIWNNRKMNVERKAIVEY